MVEAVPTNEAPRDSGTPSVPPAASGFDYSAIPSGYYDRVLRSGHPVRRLWHVSKFERVLDYLPPEGGGSILDIGCFAGSFLSMVPRYRFERQVGVDILPEQVAYATANHSSPFRSFRVVPSIYALRDLDEPFDCVTSIEVIEHLTPSEIRALFRQLEHLVAPGGRLVLTTPNYASAWPLIELLLNKVSDVSYEEQHVTRFTYFDFEKKLEEIYPRVWSSFSLELKTTTHFLTPFLAGFSYEIARGLSRVVPHQTWRQPFGNLLLAVLTRTGSREV
ncbi:MAG: class I SAM-dependent methyltransferase [Myxococcales bacterium]|nr:class I SAM-dependent methyltransferase [Myxococcales bacterium]